GNYLKCLRRPDGGWQVADFAARSYGKKSKEALQDLLVAAYSRDELTTPPPVTEDGVLLSLAPALQKAKQALAAGAGRVLLPLGFTAAKVLTYRCLKPSAFLFRTPEQRAAVVRQWQRFEQQTGHGLELLALRRAYRGRRQGSLADLASAVYEL